MSMMRMPSNGRMGVLLYGPPIVAPRECEAKPQLRPSRRLLRSLLNPPVKQKG
jgi:hypothetical protein